MSLYNNVSETVNSGSGFGGNFLQGAIKGAIGGAVGAGVNALGGGKLATAVGRGVQSLATTAATNAVNRFVPARFQKAINLGANTFNDLASGDWESAALKVWDSGIIGDLIPGSAGGLFKQAAFWGKATPLYGGISPAEAKEFYDSMRAETLGRKNLFLIEITSQLNGGANNISERFNLFTTEVEYQPYILSGEAQKVGGANVDLVSGNEPVNLSITTYDDDVGTIKRWFADHQGMASCRDGTINEPGKYAIRIRIVHNFCKEHSGAYEDIGLFRPVDLSVSFSRREDDFSEIQMQFAQLDTFVRP
jgi:hypothetical protein